MDLITALETIAATISGYAFETEASHMSGAEASYPAICFEEIRSGLFSRKQFATKTTQVELYFVRRITGENNRATREAARQEIEREAVLPFMKAFNQSGLFREVENWRFRIDPPHFNEAEAGIVLIFDCTQHECLPEEEARFGNSRV